MTMGAPSGHAPSVASVAFVASVTLGLACAGCGGGSGQPPPQGDLLASDASALRDSPSPADATSVDEDAGPWDAAGRAADAGADSAAAEGDVAPGEAGASDAGPPPEPAVCVAGYRWKTGREWVSDSIARFGGVSADGLTLAWTDTAGDVLTADRLGEASDFEPPVGVPPPGVPVQPDGRVALDATGTMLLAIDATGGGFLLWQRTAGQPWASRPASDFRQTLAPNAPPGTTLSEPVFGASGRSFFYLLTPPAADADAGADAGADSGADAAADATATSSPPRMYESRWDASTGAWGPGVALTEPELASIDATHRRRPTGASSDGRTLFFFDEIGRVERAAWRSDPSAPFSHFEDVPAAPDAAPNAACSLLYCRGTDPEAGTEGINVAQ